MLWKLKKCPAVAIYPSVALSLPVKHLTNVDTATGWLEDFFHEENYFDKEYTCVSQSPEDIQGEQRLTVFHFNGNLVWRRDL